MSAEQVNLLIQAGIAGVFAIFAITMVKSFTDYLAARDTILSDTLMKLAQEMGRLADAVRRLEDKVK